MNVHLVCAVPADAKKGHPCLELELKIGVRCSIWVLGIDPRFLQEQQGLLTSEPFL